MKILVSTSETQGEGSGDFCWTDEGEILIYSFTETCGQPSRNLVGINTRKATTTFKVADLDMSPDDYFAIVAESNARAGLSHAPAEPSMRLLDVAEQYEVGEILDKQGEKFGRRESMVC